MPIYEYRCLTCGGVSSLFIRSMNGPLDPVCSHCKSADVRRAVSSFAYHKSLKSVHSEYGRPPGPGAPSLEYYKDPRNVGRYAEEAFRKHGVEMPPSVRDNIDAAREGVLPKGLDL